MTVVPLPADTWTLVAPAGFGSGNFHIQGNVEIIYAFGNSAPLQSDTRSGGLMGDSPIQATIGDSDPLKNLYMRPALPATHSWVRVVL